MKLTDAFQSILGVAPSPKCPDCGASLNGEGCCDECGYGTGEEEEEEGEDESEGASLQELLDIKDELQRVLEKVNRLILKSGD